MKLPTPEAGLVIGYSYLWAREHSAGRQEGVKNRPCAIVAARQVIEGRHGHSDHPYAAKRSR
jgi:hypothetical protein